MGEQALALACSAGAQVDALLRRLSNLSEEKPMPYEQIRKAYSFPFELRPYQVSRVNDHCVSNLAGLYWEPGCVDSDTEYLTPAGWSRIADYAGGPVAQFNPDNGMAEFVEPLQWVKLPCDEMWHITAQGVDQMLSDEHRVLWYDSEGNYHVQQAADFLVDAIHDGHDSVWLAQGVNQSGEESGAILDFKAPQATREPSTDGFKYCFTVPTGFLVLRRNGCIFTTGNSGKTAGSTHWALFRSLEGKADQWVVVMPPILLEQWAKWLRSIKDADTGAPLEVTVYKGTPKQRAAANLGADFILMSYGIFKNDFEHLYETLQTRSVGVICDEAQAIKNITTQTHKAVKLFSEGRELTLLTGTPISDPGDAYAYIRLMAPGVYRNQRHFEKLHVGDVDEYGHVTQWINMDVLEANMKINTSRVIRREVQSELPTITYTPITYKLDPAHEKLYKRIAEEKLVEFADGREIDAISAQALRMALQQIVINWGEFADDESLKPAAMELVEEILDELSPHGKLVVVANFIRTNRYLLKTLAPYGAVAIYGEVSPKDKQAALHRFINDASCRVLVIQPQSAGIGVDGLQHVCADMLFLEAPSKAPAFHQTAARLDRDGQVNPVHCRVAIASGTVQVRMFKKLLDNDETINAIQGGYEDLKEAIFGD